MPILKPTSILQLTLTGFLAVTILLVAALIVMANQLEALSARSQSTVMKATQAMRTGRELVEQLIAMERNARQYTILLDKELLDVYATRWESFVSSAQSLDALNINGEVDNYIMQILADAEKAAELIKSNPSDKQLTTLYTQLLNMANQILSVTDGWIDQQLNELDQHAAYTQRLLRIQALLLVSTSLLLAGLFTILITRPLAQIKSAIRQLGGGSYDTPIEIKGPLDLQALGVSLEWLRNHLGELEQQRTFFLRHASHELKTPLTAIQEGTALLHDRLVGPLNQQQYEVVHILRKSCRRLQGQIENLLQYNVDSLSILKPMPHPIRLDKVIGHVIMDHELIIKSLQINIVQKLEKIVVYGDEEQLRTIVDNLLANAIKYSPKGGIVDIRLAREGEHAIFDLMDEGPGIPEEERRRIFEVFYQGRAPEREHFGGSGLGLAITQEYVRLNDGTIEVLDAERGAHFRVRVPLSTEKVHESHA